MYSYNTEQHLKQKFPNKAQYNMTSSVKRVNSLARTYQKGTSIGNLVCRPARHAQRLSFPCPSPFTFDSLFHTRPQRGVRMRSAT